MEMTAEKFGVLVPNNRFLWHVLGANPRDFLIGSQQNAPSLWRILSDYMAGRSKNLQRKTIERFGELFIQRKGLPKGRLSHPAPNPDAIIERLDEAERCAKDAIAQGDLPTAFKAICRCGFPEWPSFEEILGRLDLHAPKEHFLLSAEPLLILTSLYLLARLEVDLFGDVNSPVVEHLLPIKRERKLVRPMTRLLESEIDGKCLNTDAEIATYLLGQNRKSFDSDCREARNWKSGIAPAWNRIDHIWRVLAHRHPDGAKGEFYFCLLGVKALDGLLSYGEEISKRQSMSNYDCLSPFLDYPLIYDFALAQRGGATAAIGTVAPQ